MKYNRKLTILFALAISIVVGLTATGFSFAKYYGTKDSEFLNISDEFYFSSSALEGQTNSYLYNGGSKTFAFDINNFEDFLRINTDNITYSVSVAANNSFTEFSITKDGNPFAGSSTLVGGMTSTDTLVLNIDAGYTDNTLLTITIQSNSPYSETIIAYIHLRTLPPASFSIVDLVGADFCTLNIVVNGTLNAGAIHIVWTEVELLVDNTNSWVASGTLDVNGITNIIYGVTLSAIPQSTLISIRFVKSDTLLDYSVATTDVDGGIITLPDLIP